MRRILGRFIGASCCPSLRVLLNYVGALVGLLGCIFVFLKLLAYREQIDLARFGFGAVSLLLAVAVVYGISSIFLAIAWRHILASFGVHLRFRFAVWICGITQLGKYIPGNVFHFAGRQSVGVAFGLSGWSLAKSALIEIGLICAVGIIFGILVLPIFLTSFSSALAVFAFLVSWVIYLGMCCFLFGKNIAWASLFYGFFLGIAGILFVVVLGLIQPQFHGFSIAHFAVVGAYVVALLAGLLVPGAPAGLGVRELVLYVALQSLVSREDLAAAVVLGRLVSICGDMIFFLCALGCRGGRFEPLATLER